LTLIWNCGGSTELSIFPLFWAPLRGRCISVPQAAFRSSFVDVSHNNAAPPSRT
jgi:hypothetical protein